MLSKDLTSRLCLLSLFCSATFAVPVNELADEAGLVARADDDGKGTDKSNPKDAKFDVTAWRDISEEDCYVMLCLKKGERTWQRIEAPGLNENNYRDSGAKAVPFRKDQVPKRHTGQINPNPGRKTETNSAEEFPWESMAQGGSGANLLPATRGQQSQQGNSVRTGFRASEIDLGEWFRITFTGNLGPICQALQKDPPDTSICKNPQEYLFGKKINLKDWVWYMTKVGGGLVYYHAAGGSKGKVGKRMSSIETPALQTEGYNFVEARADDDKNGEFTLIERQDADFEDDELDPLEARAEDSTDEKLAPLEVRDVDLEDGELTEEDLEIIKP